MSSASDTHTSGAQGQESVAKPQPEPTYKLPNGDYVITSVATPAIAWRFFETPVPHQGSWVSSTDVTQSAGQRWRLKNTRNGFTLSNVANPTYYATNTAVEPSTYGPLQLQAVQANTTSTTWTLQPAGSDGAYIISPTNNLTVVAFQGYPDTFVLMAPPQNLKPLLETYSWWNFVEVADA